MFEISGIPSLVDEVKILSLVVAVTQVLH